MSNSTSTPNTGLSYKDAGVDIEAGDALAIESNLSPSAPHVLK